MQSINLKLTLEDANLVLEALGNLPFARVYGLIADVQRQAQEQIAPPAIVQGEKEGAA